MVGHESLDVNNIVIHSSEIGSGLVTNYNSVQDAIDAFFRKADELDNKENEKDY